MAILKLVLCRASLSVSHEKLPAHKLGCMPTGRWLKMQVMMIQQYVSTT